MNRREGAIISAYTGILIGSFEAFHEYVEEIMGCPIFTHQFVALAKDIKVNSSKDFMALNEGIATSPNNVDQEIDVRRHNPVFTPEILAELKETIAKSTDVVNWYDHGREDGTIRGPWHRWFKCEEADPVAQEYVSSVADDVKFACSAMQNFLPLIKEIERLKEYEWKYNDLCK